jgi:Putative beta-barrel porin 2
MTARLVLFAAACIGALLAISVGQAPLETTPIMPPITQPPAEQSPTPSPAVTPVPDEQTRPLEPVPDAVREAEPFTPLLPGATPAPDIDATPEPTEPPPGPTPTPEIEATPEPTALPEPTPARAVDLTREPTTLPPAPPATLPLGQPTTLPPGQPTTLAPGEETLLLEEEAVAALPEESRRRWRIIPLLSGGVVYDDNIFVTNEDPVADVIWTMSFGGIYELGDFRNRTENYLAAQWIGNPVIYTENSAQNAFNQYAGLILQYRFNRLVLRLDSNFSHVKGPNREVNTITTTTTFWNALQFRYDYSAKTAFDVTLLQNTSLVEDFQNTSRYQASAGMDYLIMPKTKLGARGVVGVLTSSEDPIQFYQQALARLEYTFSDKLTFMFEGGVQFLEFEGSDTVKVYPVFSLGAQYRPFAGTSFALVGYRNVVSATTLAGQDYVATGFQLQVQQRLLQKCTAMVGFGYENDDYFGTTEETETDRVDNYLFVRPRLTYAFVDWFSASLFYEFRQNTSTQESSSFDNNRAGFEILTRF